MSRFVGDAISGSCTSCSGKFARNSVGNSSICTACDQARKDEVRRNERDREEESRRDDERRGNTQTTIVVVEQTMGDKG